MTPVRSLVKYSGMLRLREPLNLTSHITQGIKIQPNCPRTEPLSVIKIYLPERKAPALDLKTRRGGESPWEFVTKVNVKIHAIFLVGIFPARE